MAEKEKRSRTNKEYGESSLTLFREVKKAVDKAIEGSGVSCVLVTSIEKQLQRDPRTVRLHLKLLEEADYGRFSADGKLFCPKRMDDKSKKY